MTPPPRRSGPGQEALAFAALLTTTYVACIAAWRYADQIQQALAQAWGWFA